MYKVVTRFIDILNPQHYYNVGDEFISKDNDRINNLLDLEFIEKVEEIKTEIKKSKTTKAKKTE